MGRLPRLIVGLLLLLGGLVLGYRYGAAAYLSAVVDPVPVAVTRPCEPVTVAAVDVQVRCAGTWAAAGREAVTGQVYGVREADAGGTVRAAAAGEYAFVVPERSALLLGWASLPVLLIALVLLLGGERRRRRRSRRYAGHSDWDTSTDGDGGHWDGGDSGGDSGGGDGGGGD
jgi:hypothetical protein